MSCTTKALPTNWWEAEIDIGATFQWALFYTANDAAVNLTGVTFRAAMKRDPFDPSVAYDLAAEGCLAIRNAAGGEVALVIPATATAGFTGTYSFSIDYVFPTSPTIRVAQGTWTTRKAATP